MLQREKVMLTRLPLATEIEYGARGQETLSREEAYNEWYGKGPGRRPLPMQRTLIGAWVMMIVFPDEQRRGFASMQHATCYASCAPVNTAAGVCRM